MNILETQTRINIGIPEINISPHWAYYIAGAIFIVFSIVSIIYTYYFITHTPSEEVVNKLSGFKKFWLKNRIAFILMIDVICVLVSIFFMINGS